MNKLLLLIILFILTACGFTPLNNSNQKNFNIINYEVTGNKTVNKYLIKNLEKFKNSSIAKNNYELKINSEMIKTTSSKDTVVLRLDIICR